MKIKIYESTREYGELVTCERDEDHISCIYSTGAKPSIETTISLNNIIKEYYFKLKLSIDTNRPSMVNINNIYRRKEDGLKVFVKDIMMDLTTFENVIILDGLRKSLDKYIKIAEDDFLEKYEKCNIKKHVIIITGDGSSTLMENSIKNLTNYNIKILQDSYLFAFTRNGVKNRMENMFSISPECIDDFMIELTNIVNKYSADDLSKYLNSTITHFYDKNSDDDLLMIYGGDNQQPIKNVLKDINPNDITWMDIDMGTNNSGMLSLIEYFYKDGSLSENDRSRSLPYCINDSFTFNHIMNIRTMEFLDILFDKIIC